MSSPPPSRRGRARLFAWLLHPTAMIVLACPALVAHAQAACSWEREWDCYGVLEYRLRGQSPVQFMRTRVYSNLEVEGQVIEDGVERRFLQVRPSELTLFSDFVEKEFEAARRDRSFGAEFAEACFAPISAALAARYAQPRDVPNDDTTTEFDDANLLVIIITTRKKPGTIAFHLIFRKPATVEIEGNWTGPRREPLPDDFDISGWKHEGDFELKTVGEARAAPDVFSPGVGH